MFSTSSEERDEKVFCCMFTCAWYMYMCTLYMYSKYFIGNDVIIHMYIYIDVRMNIYGGMCMYYIKLDSFQLS